jgi:hypothetical protein
MNARPSSSLFVVMARGRLPHLLRPVAQGRDVVLCRRQTSWRGSSLPEGRDRTAHLGIWTDVYLPKQGEFHEIQYGKALDASPANPPVIRHGPRCAPVH